jgi:hypothetical protein
MAVCWCVILVYRGDVAREKAIDVPGIRLGGAGRRDVIGPAAVPITVFGRHVCGVVGGYGRQVFGVNRRWRAEIRSADCDAVWVATRRFLDGRRSFAVMEGGQCQ